MCLKERSSQNPPPLKTWILRKKIVVAFILWDYSGLYLKKFVQKRSSSLLFMAMTAALFVGLLILSYQSNCWQAGYDMGRGVMDLELPKSRYLVSLYSDLMDQFEGSMITSENSSVARESSRVIILKSRVNSTGHSACTSEVRDIFDRQTHVPNGRWQMMFSRVLHAWDRRNSTAAPVRNITAWLEFELAYLEAAVQYINHYATGTPISFFLLMAYNHLRVI